MTPTDLKTLADELSRIQSGVSPLSPDEQARALWYALERPVVRECAELRDSEGAERVH